jgi:UDP-glucuronate decarboxylase
MTIEAIAREVLTCTQSNSTLEFKPLPADDPKRRKPVITTAERLLGWRPQIPLRKGLEATIAYFALEVAGRGPSHPDKRPPTSRRTGRAQLALARSQ